MLNAIFRQVVLSNFLLPLGHNQESLASGTILRAIDPQSICLKKDFLNSTISSFKRMSPPAFFYKGGIR